MVFNLMILFVCSSFKLFLELEPQIRDVIFKFYESKYATCLRLLDEIRVRYRVPQCFIIHCTTAHVYCYWAMTFLYIFVLMKQDNLLLDMYLAPHVKSLYSEIRSRGLIQYFSPYASADLAKMAQSFNTSVSALENELMGLILDGQILARIDSHNKILCARKMDERSLTFEKSLQMGEEYERRTKLMILRAATVRAQIQVKVY